LLRLLLAGGGVVLLGACEQRQEVAVDTAQGAAVAAADSAALRAADSISQRAAAGPAVNTPVANVRLEVDLTARKLHVYRDSQLTATHSVAVGSPEWPTRTGEWHVTQVVWNPEWVPPDESWAEEREPRQPGDPANPLGRAQLIYDPPRTIHGTNDPTSIGKAVSHGSIRVTNAVAMQLARELMEATGAGKDESWYKSARDNRTVKQIVDLPQRVPIRVY
jgi:lipoprotein-anchoring transpeptidase ErfK/SrfK